MIQRALNITTRKVGGIRFLKIGCFTFSFCVSRKFRPFPGPGPRSVPRYAIRDDPHDLVPFDLMPVEVPMPAPRMRPFRGR